MDGYYLACFIVVGGLNAIGIAICVWAIGRDALHRVSKMQRVGTGDQINKSGRNPPPPKNFNKPPPTPNPPPTNASVTLQGVSESFIKALQHTKTKHADIIKKLEDK